ncbi:acetyl-coenzyme A synthetase [Alphaproteobacteria bacterium]|nr:acetyl-coenzyme A synthetase [Alphaproteobacteria bacterium]
MKEERQGTEEKETNYDGIKPGQSLKRAISFEGDEVGRGKEITYCEMQREVRRLQSALHRLGVKKGTVVSIYLPMVTELIVAMLACVQLGAVHSVIFSGFSARALAERLRESGSEFLITQNVSQRGGKEKRLIETVISALGAGTFVKKVLLVNSEKKIRNGTFSRTATIFFCQDFGYDKADEIKNVAVDPEDPLFILFTSGSTGKPKGVVHRRKGYMEHVEESYRQIFGILEGDVHFCTADIGWITGHSYGVYGPLSNGVTTILYQGTPTYPDPGRLWRIIDEHNVTSFYTSPTALRTLMKADSTYVEKASLESLRVLGTVGEALDPVTWRWFFEKIGHGRCPIKNTWWQTETGGALMCPDPASAMKKPGCVGKPLFGVEPVLMGASGPIKKPGEKGELCLKNSWIGRCIGIWNDPDYFNKAYFAQYEGLFTTGDMAMRDEDGDYWILGRTDDVLNVSGHRLDSAEMEKAVLLHPNVAEACVVGFPHDVKGQGIFVFAVPKNAEAEGQKEQIQEIKNQMRKEIGAIATPDGVLLVDDLPKTRSGKIVRRFLRKITNGDDLEQEDTTMLLNEEVLKPITEQMKRWFALTACGA